MSGIKRGKKGQSAGVLPTDHFSNQKIGPEAIRHMKSQVQEWTKLIVNRCDHLGNYVNTLESLNDRLESRTDRSLALSEVRLLFYIYNPHIIDYCFSRDFRKFLNHQDWCPCLETIKWFLEGGVG